MIIRRILTSAAAVATVAAAAIAAPAVAAPVASNGTGSTAGTTAVTGQLPRPAFSANLHAQFAQLSGHVTVGKRSGVVPPLDSGAGTAQRESGATPAAPAACAEPNCNMPYNGGTVQHSPRVYVVFWGPGWQNDSSQQASMNFLVSFYKGLGTSGDTWSQVSSQYTDSSGRPAFGNGVFAESGIDTSPPPSEVTPTDIGDEAAAAASKFGITDLQVANAQVVVASQSGTCFSDGFAGSSCQPVPPAYCGWHDATPFGGGQLSFTNLPYQPDGGMSCGQNFINSTSAGTLDGFSIIGGHEYAESVTDPVTDLNTNNLGWIDLNDTVSGGEIADKCAWAGGNWNQNPPDPAGDVKLSTGTFAMQSLWSNAVGRCVMSALSVTAIGNQTSGLGHPVSLQVHASTTLGTSLTYSATGLPPGVTINRSTGLIGGTVTGPRDVYRTSVTVATYAGSSSFAFTWTVDEIGQVTGPWAKCVDNAGGRTVAGNKIVLFTCDGKAEQKISYTSAGQLQVQNGCITGGNTAFFEPCSAATNKAWTRAGSEYVNEASGKCLTDPNIDKANGTWLTVETCTNKVSQHWALP